MDFPTRLKELREEKNLNKRELGELLNISASTVSMYENGNRVPRVEVLKSLADFFNVDTDYLLGINEDKDMKKKQEEQDIAVIVDNLIKGLSSDSSLLYSGEPMDEVTKELVKASIEQAARIALARQKGEK